LSVPREEPLLKDMAETEPILLTEPARTAIAAEIPEPAVLKDAVPTVFDRSEMSEMEVLAERLKSRRTAEGGYRTLITGESDEIVPYAEAIELVKALAKNGAQPIIIDWSPSGDGFARSAGLDMSAGFNDLLTGDAGFEDIIQRLPATRVHAVASGQAVSDAKSEIDPDRLNLMLDALDEAYDHIVVVGRHDEARRLFEGIEGRFDAGITVASSYLRASEPEQLDGTFLGFEVAEINVIRFERREPVAPPLMQRLARVTQQHNVPMARQA
jgi:hypothetical protein